ncbi:ferrichrome/ferrioxamine B periplasmic transporter [Pragia fontium]|uniref:ABC transporter substrate-binding protein n=1 Tax=Pragia fontium TaxID=82985 RepID=UPI000E04D923|nr:ABC transporter substrate-binding protein [Pragia fontium]SUB81830.1 ferrichrome/ferrioxamine B periplasmic transporter [Pragia fontium]
MNNRLLKLLLIFIFSISTAYASEWPKEVTDILGNKVVVTQKPQRVVLASGYSFVALSFVHEDPASVLIGWGSELKKFDTATYELYKKTFPKLATLKTIGSGSGDELSVETILSLSPDLVIFEAWQAPRSQALIALLRKSHIPVVFVDFYQSPLENTLPSVRLLGQLLDREQQTEQLIAFYQSHMERLTSRLNDPKIEHPRVLLHAYPGVWECCWTSGAGGVGEYITLFKGINVGADKFPTGNGGQLSLEYLIQKNPQVYIATGHSGVDPNKALPLGTGVDMALSQRQLSKLVAEKGLNTFDAVQNGRVYGFWNYFSGSPLNIVGAEVMAKWIQPQLYQDVDPQKTMDEMNQRFLPVTLTGTYWLTLQR